MRQLLFCPLELRKKHSCLILIRNIGVFITDKQIFFFKKTPDYPYQKIYEANECKKWRIKQESKDEPRNDFCHSLRMTYRVVSTFIHRMLFIRSKRFLSGILKSFEEQDRSWYAQAHYKDYPSTTRNRITKRKGVERNGKPTIENEVYSGKTHGNRTCFSILLSSMVGILLFLLLILCRPDGKYTIC